jgi:hypothetical protein
MTTTTSATAQQEGESLPSEKRYCVWICPTHATNQRPAGKPVKKGCNHVQYRTTNPDKKSQATCKNCGKKPWLEAMNYRRIFPYTKQGKVLAKQCVEDLSTDTGWLRT